MLLPKGVTLVHWIEFSRQRSYDTRMRYLAIVALFAGMVTAQDQDHRAGYIITYVKSDRVWKFGIKHEPYDKISQYLVDQLQLALKKKGLHAASPPETARYRLTAELLEVTSHSATVKKPGNDVAATLQVARGDQILYSKGYHGEAKTWNAPRASVIERAVNALVQDIIDDDKVLAALR
jgi:hypothetical protein